MKRRIEIPEEYPIAESTHRTYGKSFKGFDKWLHGRATTDETVAEYLVPRNSELVSMHTPRDISGVNLCLAFIRIASLRSCDIHVYHDAKIMSSLRGAIRTN